MGLVSLCLLVNHYYIYLLLLLNFKEVYGVCIHVLEPLLQPYKRELSRMISGQLSARLSPCLASLSLRGDTSCVHVLS